MYILRKLRVFRQLCSRETWLAGLLFLMIFGLPAATSAYSSDGSDGPFHPTGNVTLDLPEDGVFNFTSITIDNGITVKFNRNAANTPVFLLATEAVIINGTINISAWAQTGGPGGGNGGDAGVGTRDGTGGLGPSPGAGGPSGFYDKWPGHAGGGGGMATAGTEAVRHTADPPAPGGSAIPFPEPLTGGSGGGGGGGWTCFGVPCGGGHGGGGGGGILISTPANITIGGKIMANGAWGGYSFANVFGYGGPGGGGSGGVIDLEATSITLDADGVLEATGCPGSGISTMPIWHPEFSCGADGGIGYVRVKANELYLYGIIDAELVIVPPPCEGDFDYDGDVDGSDLAVFAADFGRTDCGTDPPCEGDFDGDGDVDGSDLAVFAADFGRTDCPR